MIVVDAIDSLHADGIQNNSPARKNFLIESNRVSASFTLGDKIDEIIFSGQ